MQCNKYTNGNKCVTSCDPAAGNQPCARERERHSRTEWPTFLGYWVIYEVRSFVQLCQIST